MQLHFKVHDGGKQAWLLDSGASSHLTPPKEDFTQYHELEDPIQFRIVDGAKMEAIEKGKVIFAARVIQC